MRRCPPTEPIAPSVRSWITALAACLIVGAGLGCARTEVDPPRLLIIGLDGADLRWLDRLHGEGRLPHLGGLMERGVSAPLETVHNSSPVIWTSIATGVVPERHGVVAFLNEEKKPYSSTERKRPAFWNILTAAGRSVGVLGWWTTFPAEQVEGYMISPYVIFDNERTGVVWSDADPYKTYPPGLFGELAEHLYEPDDISRHEMRRVFVDAEQTTYTPWAFARDKTYFEIALRLMEERPTETVAVYLQGIDVASHDLVKHAFGRHHNKKRRPRIPWSDFREAYQRVEAMYDRIDLLVGGLLERTGADTDVIVVSDHGWEYDGTSHWNRNAGIFVAAGPSFGEGSRLDSVSVLEIAPLVLAVLGLPVAEAFDGDLPDSVLREQIVAAVRRVDDYPIPAVSPQDGAAVRVAEDEQMIELLRGLGYVE